MANVGTGFLGGIRKVHEGAGVHFPVASATVIAVGDMVALVSDLLVPVSSLADGGTLDANQIALALIFVGVAMEPSRNGDTLEVLVDVGLDSEFRFDADSATYEIGDLLSANEQSSGTALENGELIAAVTSASTIWIVSKVISLVEVQVRAVVNIFHPQAVA